MFAVFVVGAFLLIVFGSEFVKVWRRETAYRRLRDYAEAPGRAAVKWTPTTRSAARPVRPAQQAAPGLHERIELEIAALRREVGVLQDLIATEGTRHVYAHSIETGMVHDASRSDRDPERRTRRGNG